MEKHKKSIDKRHDLIMKVLKFEEVLFNHNYKDELCGDHISIPTDRVEDYILKIKRSITDLLNKSSGRTFEQRTINNAILHMNQINRRDESKEEE